MRIGLLAAVMMSAAALSACGGDDGGSDPRLLQVTAVAENATNAYAQDGPGALYDYVAPEITGRCTKDQFADDLADQSEPSGFRGVDGVEFDGDKATATIVQIFRDHEEKVEWTFVETGDGSWRIIGLPGLGDCAGG